MIWHLLPGEGRLLDSKNVGQPLYMTAQKGVAMLAISLAKSPSAFRGECATSLSRVHLNRGTLGERFLSCFLGKVSLSVNPNGDESPYGPARTVNDVFDPATQSTDRGVRHVRRGQGAEPLHARCARQAQKLQ